MKWETTSEYEQIACSLRNTCTSMHHAKQKCSLPAGLLVIYLQKKPVVQWQSRLTSLVTTTDEIFQRHSIHICTILYCQLPILTQPRVKPCTIYRISSQILGSPWVTLCKLIITKEHQEICIFPFVFYLQYYLGYRAQTLLRATFCGPVADPRMPLCKGYQDYRRTYVCTAVITSKLIRTFWLFGTAREHSICSPLWSKNSSLASSPLFCYQYYYSWPDIENVYLLPI